MTPPLPADVAGVAFRPLRESDAEALLALARAVESVDDQPFASALEDVRQSLADPNTTLADDTLAGVAPDGSLACFGAVRLRQSAVRRRAAGLEGHVHPDWRRRGLGNAVLAWTEARANQRLAEQGGRGPAYLELWADERLADRRALFTRRGFEPIRYYDDMRRPLADPLPDIELPTDLRLVRWSPALDEQFRAAHNSAFEDHWGSEPLTDEEWRHRYSNSPMFRSDLTVGLADGERVVAYVMAYHAPSDSEVTGRIEGWLGQVGTLRGYRGRGLASALMVHVMREMLGAGMDHAALDVDSENPSGAVGLYQRLGFHSLHRYVRWAKEADRGGSAAETGPSAGA